MISYLSIGALIVVIAALIALIIVQQIHIQKLNHQATQERIAITSNNFSNTEDLILYWNEERKELLDRIQAPGFHDLKAAEVRTIKAQSNEEPKKPIVYE